MMIKSNVRMLMAERELNIVQLSLKVGVSRQSLSKLINNQIKQFDADVLDKLCTYFKCGVGDILKHVSEEQTA